MNPNKKHIENLIEKYFEGLTSLKEEQFLRDYFQQENLPVEWEIYRPVFQFFTSEREQKQPKRIPLFRWISIAAAACLLMFFGLQFFKTSHNFPETSIAYIDGKKYTDLERIHMEALQSLENLSEGNADIYSSQVEALEFIFENN